MKTYYEAHVTMEGDRDLLRASTEVLGWKFSAIDGDPNMGSGVRCYATRQFKGYLMEGEVVGFLNHTADRLASAGATITRRKVERVIYDDRSSLVQPCDGPCAACQEAR